MSDSIFVLFLNPMRDRAEVVRPVARASSREALVALVERERQPHTAPGPGGWGNEGDGAHPFHHSFREDGPLGWMNDCGSLAEDARPGWPGIRILPSVESLRQDAEVYARNVAAIPEVS